MSEREIDAAEARHMPGGPFSKASQDAAAAREQKPPVLLPGMLVYEPGDPDPPADGGPLPNVWVVLAFDPTGIKLKTASHGDSHRHHMQHGEPLPEGWRVIDSGALGRLLEAVDLVGDETEPDLTYLFADSKAGQIARQRRIQSARGDDGYTALAKEIAALAEQEAEREGAP